MTRVPPDGGVRRPAPERMPGNLDTAAGRLYTQRL